MMIETILVNKVKIEKSIINQFLLQNKKLEAVKYICEKANIGLASSKDIVDRFGYGSIDNFDDQDLFLLDGAMESKKDSGVTTRPNTYLIKNKIVKYLTIGIVLLCGFLFLKYIIGFNNIPHHLETLRSEIFSTNEENNEGTAMPTYDTPMVDSVETTAAADVVNLYPIDTNWFDKSEIASEIARIKNAHFEKLKVSTRSPSDENAQTALIHLTNRRLTDVIINQKLNIKIGECYENPNTDGNFRCVSCMILLYNREEKHWQEAPDGYNFMKNAYDFYQASENDFWEAKDLSMRIPYDYDLIKKYELK